MMRIERFGVIAVLAIGSAAAPAFAEVTVGQFYTELAQAKHYVSVDAASAEANLRGAGYDLPKLPLDKSLTEGDMTAISNVLGLAVRTERPSAPVTASQLNTYMASFGDRIGDVVVSAGDPVSDVFETDARRGNKHKHHNNSKHRKKPRKKKNHSPHEPI